MNLDDQIPQRMNPKHFGELVFSSSGTKSQNLKERNNQRKLHFKLAMAVKEVPTERTVKCDVA